MNCGMAAPLAALLLPGLAVRFGGRLVNSSVWFMGRLHHMELYLFGKRKAYFLKKSLFFLKKKRLLLHQEQASQGWNYSPVSTWSFVELSLRSQSGCKCCSSSASPATPSVDVFSPLVLDGAQVLQQG